MNDRLMTAVGALAALLVLAMLLFPSGPADTVTRPTTAEIGPNGYAALMRWLEAEGIAVKSWRTRLDTLSRDSGGGHLLITTMPHRDRLRRDEARAVSRWLLDGNTLLVLAALDDTPDWSNNVNTRYFLADLEKLTGLKFRVPRTHQGETIGTPGSTTAVMLDAARRHPLMNGVAELEGFSDSVATFWEARREEGDERLTLALARERDSGLAAMWQVRLGDGTVIVSALGSLLTNRAIGAAGNGRFMANVIRHHLAPDGVVIFDDMHQGLSTLYDPEAFFGDPRLGSTLLFILGFWALYMLGSNNRLAPLSVEPEVPSQGDFVAGVGGFLARKLSPAEAGRLMVDAWFNELRRRGIVSRQDSPWRRLQDMPTVTRESLARLRVHRDALQRGDGDVDLSDLHDTIEELRRMLR